MYGGQDVRIQAISLRRGVKIVIGTPGRVLDLLKRRILKTDSISTLVLDEADRIKALLNNEYSKILGEDYKRSVKKKIDYIILEFKQRKKAISFTSIEKSSKSR